LTEHSGRFGKFGFLADQAKFPPSHGSRASTIGRLFRRNPFRPRFGQAINGDFSWLEVASLSATAY
jgi:hypothetical protein